MTLLPCNRLSKTERECERERERECVSMTERVYDIVTINHYLH